MFLTCPALYLHPVRIFTAVMLLFLMLVLSTRCLPHWCSLCNVNGVCEECMWQGDWRSLWRPTLQHEMVCLSLICFFFLLLFLWLQNPPHLLLPLHLWRVEEESHQHVAHGVIFSPEGSSVWKTFWSGAFALAFQNVIMTWIYCICIANDASAHLSRICFVCMEATWIFQAVFLQSCRVAQHLSLSCSPRRYRSSRCRFIGTISLYQDGGGGWGWYFAPLSESKWSLSWAGAAPSVGP